MSEKYCEVCGTDISSDFELHQRDTICASCDAFNAGESAGSYLVGQDRDVWRERAEKAEAQAAAIREQFRRWVDSGEQCEDASDALLAVAATCELLRQSDAGRTLLAELAALREVAEVARYACCDRDGDPTQQKLDAFAMLDAARKGEP